MTIALTVTGSSITAPSDTVLVCSNDYTITVTYGDAETAAEWDGLTPYLLIACTQDGADTETDLLVTDGTAELDALPSCLSVRVRLHAEAAGDAEKRTEALAIPCTPSIRDTGSAAYSAPYDAYNAMCALLNGRLNGRYTPQQVEAAVAEIGAHTTEELNRAAYKRAIAAMAPETRLTGKLTLADNTEIDIDNDIITTSATTLTTSALRDNAVLPGGVPAAELGVTFAADADLPRAQLRGAKLALVFAAMQENGQWGEVPLGEHTVYTVGDDTATGTPVVAYDSMKRLDAITPTAAGFVVGKDYSPNEIISKIATAAGIPYAQNVDFDDNYVSNGASVNANSYVVVALGTLPRSWGWKVAISNADQYTTDAEVAAALAELYGASVTYEGTVTYSDDLPTTIEDTHIAYRVMYGGPRYNVQAAGNTIMTTRDLLMHTLAAIGGFGYIDRTTAALTIRPMKKQEATTEIIQNKVLRQRVSSLQYQLYCLTTVCDYPDKEGIMISEERREYTLWDTGATVLLPSNPLLAGLVASNPRQAVFENINHLTDALDPVVFHPARIETYGDPSIEPWEWITMSARSGTESVPAGALTWRYRGTQTIDTGGADVVAGLEISQAERAVLGDKITASQSSQNTMRSVYSHIMATHEGLHSFRHEEIAHYRYAEFGGKED